MTSSSLLRKEVLFSATDLCFHHASTGSKGCLRSVDIALAAGVWPPRLLRVDGVRVELEDLELRSGGRSARGSVTLSLETDRERPLAARAVMTVDGRPLTVEASAASDVFERGRLERLDVLWTAAYAGEIEAEGRIGATSRGEAMDLELESSGRAGERAFRTDWKGVGSGEKAEFQGRWELSSVSGPFRLVELSGCRGAAGLRPHALMPRDVSLDCGLRAVPGPVAGVPFPVPEVLGRASVRGESPREDLFDARADVDLAPVRDWYESSGRLRLRAVGRLGSLGEARLTHELEGRVAVPRFEELDARLRGTALAVPDILRPLRGPVELTVKGSGDPRRREHRLSLEGRSRLADGPRRLAVTASCGLSVKDPLLPSREASLEGEVVFDDVALELPRLGLRGFARSSLDEDVSAASSTIVGRLRGRSSVEARLTQGDRITAGASIDLGPVRDWYEASGRLRLRLEGRLPRLRESRIAQQLEVRLGVPRFEEIVGRLEGTALEVPAPFNSLRGPLTLELRSAGDLRDKEQNIRLKARTRLTGGRQALALSASAEVSLRDALLPSRNASATGEIVLEDVALELPRLELGALPDVTLDPRISVSTAAPAPAAGGVRSPFGFDVRIRTEKPALLLSNLAKQPVPVDVDLSVRSVPPRLSGRIWVERFDTELFRRPATVEHFRLEPTAGGSFELDGLLLYRSAEAVVRILVLGTNAKPRVDLSSDPPLARAQIIALLLFNKAPEQLDAGQSESVGHAESALASNAFGLASLYLFASTPVEYVGYDPAAKTYSLRLRVPGGATVELGTNKDESSHVRLRKRLGAHWALQTEMRTQEREGNIVTTFLEWFSRF